MPYEWITPVADAAAPLAELHLWPYRSLPKKGFVIFVGISAAVIGLPLMAVLGSPVLWGLLPFLVATIAGLWWALQRSYRDGSTLEELRFWPDRMHLVRYNPRGPKQEWEANPFWVRADLLPEGGPVKDYLTLQGAGRTVELGAFLTEEERRVLIGEVRARLKALREQRD
ncbi:MAG: DUF2244 domain-containing protein [Limimaricola sp.]|uniref:DUF2244 domain-containing protein n=1 Tax=Limimaricola sp. TaxID=2211665 RepID=UPI001D55BD2C|nr:DUF2244 domain-containing protein [Limimaricola sp.]MBI1416189.1 DUF2244 domain-containing protein [Limimaricola sp.]